MRRQIKGSQTAGHGDAGACNSRTRALVTLLFPRLLTPCSPPACRLTLLFASLLTSAPGSVLTRRRRRRTLPCQHTHNTHNRFCLDQAPGGTAILVNGAKKHRFGVQEFSEVQLSLQDPPPPLRSPLLYPLALSLYSAPRSSSLQAPPLPPPRLFSILWLFLSILGLFKRVCVLCVCVCVVECAAALVGVCVKNVQRERAHTPTQPGRAHTSLRPHTLVA